MKTRPANIIRKRDHRGKLRFVVLARSSEWPIVEVWLHAERCYDGRYMFRSSYQSPRIDSNYQCGDWAMDLHGLLKQSDRLGVYCAPADDHRRIAECLEYIRRNPTAHYPKGWIYEVETEARTAGLLRPLAPLQVGCNCRPGIDRGIVYGGDMEDVF